MLIFLYLISGKECSPGLVSLHVVWRKPANLQRTHILAICPPFFVDVSWQLNDQISLQQTHVFGAPLFRIEGSTSNKLLLQGVTVAAKRTVTTACNLITAETPPSVSQDAGIRETGRLKVHQEVAGAHVEVQVDQSYHCTLWTS